MANPSCTINCDLGEGIPIESSIIPLIDLASVACGGHFGNQKTIKDTLVLVKKFGKKAGAHPSYPDRENFGRKSLQISTSDLLQSLRAQISLFESVAEEEKLEIDHIKFHGALYNDAAEDAELANVLVDFLKKEYPKIPLLVPPHSEIEKAAKQKSLPFRLEVFGDRAYQPNYKLANRSIENSLYTKKIDVISHLDLILNHQKIRTITGELFPIYADTICFHGDNPGILDFLPYISDQFWK